MKRKFRLMSRTISQLKDDIMSKERELLRERTQRSLVDKQRERLKAELSRIDKMIKSSGKILVGQKGEISALSEVVQKGDAELTRQEKEYNSVMHERDILRTQLMQRDAEFATLSEKVKLQRSMLAQGTSQFVDLKRQSAGLDQTLENESLNLVDLQKQTEGIDGLRNDMCVRVKVKVGGERRAYCLLGVSLLSSSSPPPPSSSSSSHRRSAPSFSFLFLSLQVSAGARFDRRADEDQSAQRGA
jgi:chromosome segregation ATPase